MPFRVPDKNYKIQNLLLGTHTNDNEPNYLQIASVKLPSEIKKSEDTVMEDANEGKSAPCIRKERVKWHINTRFLFVFA